MNAERLLALYERVAEAPDSITRLRRFILDLAVRGKLVPQDPNDEPASELLKRIAKEKARLDRKERIKREPRSHDADAEPMQIPQGWALAPLADLVTVLNGRAYKQNELLSAGTPVLRVGNLFTSDKWYYSTLQLDDEKYCKKGDLIFAWSASFGPFIWDGERVIYHYHIWKLPLHSDADLSKLFLYNFLLQKTRQIKEAGHGISMIHMTKEKMEKIVVPLPPLAEQHRIVAKVDELMALCDRLEAARKDREAKRDRLSAASLARLNTPDPETFTADACFTLEALPALTTRPNQIKQLRQTILNLAVRGKLVPQDPNDEPASELLTRIAKEKARLVKAGEIRKPKLVPEVSLAEQDFLAPVGWKWSRLGDLTIITQGFAFSSGDYSSNKADGPPLIKIGDIGFNSPEVFIKGKIDEEYLVQPGDLLLGLSGSIKCAQWRGPVALLNQRIARILPTTSDLADGWLFLIVDNCLGKWRSETSKLTVQNIKSSQLFEAPVPLPPLAEQHRIVTKVDELMTLCDRLEASLTTSDQTRTRLLEATLAEALTPASVTEVEPAE